MMLAPAAMFAMFFFLSLFIQQVMGYSPLQAGFAFLPFSFGIVIGGRPGLQPGQPDRPALPRRHRHAAGGGRAVRLLAGCPYDDRSLPGHRASTCNYWTDILPFIVLMSSAWA